MAGQGSVDRRLRSSNDVICTAVNVPVNRATCVPLPSCRTSVGTEAMFRAVSSCESVAALTFRNRTSVCAAAAFSVWTLLIRVPVTRHASRLVSLAERPE